MNANDPNVGLVQAVAGSLGKLADQFVFVGGCATGLLITDLSRPPVRATIDVDLLVEVSSRFDYYALCDALRAAGFSENREVICRWVVGEVQVDVMPTDASILGFSNRWSARAVETASTVRLPNGVAIRLITPPLFIATKLEAFHGRGNGQYGESHDLEDVVNLLDGRPGILEEIRTADSDVREYLEDEVGVLLGLPGFVDSLHWHFPGDEASQDRVPEVLERLRRIAGL
jgi:predicted nucleotidyltransferase